MIFYFLFQPHKIKIIYLVEEPGEWNTQNEKGNLTENRLESRDTSWNILFKNLRKLGKALDPWSEFLFGEKVPCERLSVLVASWGLAYDL